MLGVINAVAKSTNLDDKLPVIEGDISDFGPGEPDLGGEAVVLLVDVEAERVHAEPQLGALLVLDVEVVNAVHLEVLGDLEILHHGVLTEHTSVLSVPGIWKIK